MIQRPDPESAPFYVAVFAIGFLITLLLTSPAETPGAEAPIVHHQKDVTP